MGSKVKVILRNVADGKHLDYDIEVHDNSLAREWVTKLGDLLESGNPIEKNYCWHGFPWTTRTLEYLCDQLNRHISVINSNVTQSNWRDKGLKTYVIEEHFSPDAVRFTKSAGEFYAGHYCLSGDDPNLYLGLATKHEIMNRLHNHFERLQGTVEGPSQYYALASDDVKYAIRQLNLLCHEIESLLLSQRKAEYEPEWIRPSQITTWLSAPRFDLTAEHRKLFNENKYDRKFGGVYMHWCQIGKTLFEVWKDEDAPKIDRTTCEAITELKYYSGEFDVEWGRTVARGHEWNDHELAQFYSWLMENGFPVDHAGLSLGYLPLGQIDIKGAFGTTEFLDVLKTLGNYLDVYSVEADGRKATYSYHWSDADWREKQIEFLRPGYRHDSK